MTLPVYSIRIGVFASSNTTPITVATVPSGFVYVVRCIDLVSYGSTGTDTVLIQIPSYTFYTATFNAANQHAQWTGMQVLNPGEALTAQVTIGGVAGVVSGFKLSNT